MENSEIRPVRRVRCPRCNCVLEEPSAPVYQCGGCGTTLRAKIRTANTGDVARSGLPPQSRHLDSTDVASTSRSSTPTSLDATSSSRHQHHRATDTTSRHGSGDLVSGRRHGGSGDVASTSSTPTATTGSRQGIDMTSRREPGDLVSPRNRVSEQGALIEKRGHDHQSAADQEEVHGNNSEGRRPRDAAGDAGERRAGSPAGVSVQLPGRSKDASPELQDDTEKGMKRQAEAPDAARKKHSGEAAVQPQYHHREEELAPKSAGAPVAQSPRDVLGKEDEAAAAQAAAGGKAVSPSRKNELQAENLGPLRKKILKTVDELKGDLSELFSKSPELNPTPRARRPRLPKQEQEGHVSRAAVGLGLPSARARRHAADGHRGSPDRAAKPGRVAPPPPPPRGLPSRRYRQCRADPCCHAAQLPRPCHHGCCRHHGKPECSSCRGHCCRPRTQEPSAQPRNRPPAAAKEAGNKRRLPPRNHCRPVLKGAPFIVCSSCFKLVQVPADFAVSISTKAVRKLRCGACSTVLSYSYRDPARKKAYYDQFSTDGSEPLQQGGNGCADPFAPFVDGFGLSSYSTEDEQQLHVSRNTSFGTIDGRAGRLHRLMGYGSASELLRHSPDLYESFSERTTPSVGNYDRKGKGVCVDDNDDDDYDVDDSDEEDGGRSAARGFGWALPAGTLGKGIPAPGAIRIK